MTDALDKIIIDTMFCYVKSKIYQEGHEDKSYNFSNPDREVHHLLTETYPDKKHIDKMWHMYESLYCALTQIERKNINRITTYRT